MEQKFAVGADSSCFIYYLRSVPICIFVIILLFSMLVGLLQNANEAYDSAHESTTELFNARDDTVEAVELLLPYHHAH